MTIREALQSLTPYPIPVNNIDKICIDRALIAGTTYDLTISQSDDFKLATADVYMFMYGAPSITEQDISLSVVERSNFRDMANRIYGELNDPKYMGKKYGFIGENFNG